MHLSPGSRKAPTWAWFPGLVPFNAVWDENRASDAAIDLQAFVDDALSLWPEHTVTALISYCRRNFSEVENWGVAKKLKERVKEAIESVKFQRHTTRDSLLGILDTKKWLEDKRTPKVQEDFHGSVAEFARPDEIEKLASAVVQQLDIRADMLEFIPPLFEATIKLPSFGGIIRMKHILCKYSLGSSSWEKSNKVTVAFGYDKEGDTVVYIQRRIFRFQKA